MAQKLWAYVSGLISKPALESSAPVTAESVKACNDWISEDSAAIGYIKMKCTESMVAGIPASHTTLKEVWDGLKEKIDKVSATIVLQEIRSAFFFRLSSGDPMHEISKLSAMFSHLLDRGFSIPDFICTSILIMAIPSKWNSVATFLLQQYVLDKLDWDTVSKSVISEFSCMKWSNWPSTSANKISAVKCKDDHLPFWKEKSREDKPAASGSSSGDCKEKKGRSRAGKQVKQHREAAKECQYAYMAELAIAVDLPTPTAFHWLHLLPQHPFQLSQPLKVMVGLSLPPPFIQKHYWLLSQPSLYLAGTPAQQKQGPASGLMLKRHVI